MATLILREAFRLRGAPLPDGPLLQEQWCSMLPEAFLVPYLREQQPHGLPKTK